MAEFYRYGPQHYKKCTESKEKFMEIFLEMLVDSDDVWEVERVEMSQEEYDNLPEFDGF